MIGNPKMGQQVAKLVRRDFTTLRASSSRAINNAIIVMSHGFRIQSMAFPCKWNLLFLLDLLEPASLMA